VPLPKQILLEVVTPEGLLLREEVDELQAPGRLGYFGVLPGHTPFFSTLGMGEISYWKDGGKNLLTCFWGFCEVLPDRVNILAEVGERPEDIDVGRAEIAKRRAEERLAAIKDEADYRQVHGAYVRAVTRLAVAGQRRPLASDSSRKP
jgi:F-type H+-transporting ATPase subunit epsilon